MSKVIQFPRKSEPTEVAPATFKDFAFQIMLDKLDDATKTLGLLLDVDAESAERFAQAYHSKSKSDPMLMMKTMEIRNALDNKNMNDGIELIVYCFNMSIVEAIVAFTHLAKSY